MRPRKHCEEQRMIDLAHINALILNGTLPSTILRAVARHHYEMPVEDLIEKLTLWRRSWTW